MSTTWKQGIPRRNVRARFEQFVPLLSRQGENLVHFPFSLLSLGLILRFGKGRIHRGNFNEDWMYFLLPRV